MFDTIIIGGGAAGLATAIMLKRRSKDLNIAVFEQLDRVGKKISVTGNGRCNISNKQITKEHYYSKNLEHANKILSKFNSHDTANFFSEIGIEITYEGDKAYPRSFQASSVVDGLRFATENLGIKVFTASKICDVHKNSNVFKIKTDNPEISQTAFESHTVVIATGGLAGGGKLGSNGDGYTLLKHFGHTITKQEPVIVQVKTENTITRSLKGIKTDATVSIVDGDKTIKNDYGEVLFCDYGLSGPPILQLSRFALPNRKISLDMFNDYDLQTLINILLKRKEIFKNQPLTEFFAGLLHKRLGQTVLKSCGISLSDLCNTLTDQDIENVAKTLKNFTFKVTGNTGFANAQATSGGANLSEFNDGLMSKKVYGLFAVGEVLDVDGDCGGFNLQWAWSSAHAVSISISKMLKGIQK